VTTLGVEVGSKQLELLHELVPAARVLALLVNPSNPTLADIQSRNLPAAAGALGLDLRIVKASADPDFDQVFAALAEQRASGLVIGVDAFFNTRNEQLAALAARNAIPTISPYREFAEAGGLMSYGGQHRPRLAAGGRLYGPNPQGEPPATLPVQQAVKLELVFNLKTPGASASRPRRRCSSRPTR